MAGWMKAEPSILGLAPNLRHLELVISFAKMDAKKCTIRAWFVCKRKKVFCRHVFFSVFPQCSLSSLSPFFVFVAFLNQVSIQIKNDLASMNQATNSPFATPRLWFSVPSSQQLLRFFPTLGSRTPMPLQIVLFHLLACRFLHQNMLVQVPIVTLTSS